MKKILLIFTIINFITKCINCECITFISSNPLNIPIFLQQLGSELLILPISDGTLKIDENNNVTAYCVSGFANLQLNYNNYNDYESYIGNSNKMILKCINGVTLIEDGGSFKKFKSLDCKNSVKSEIYENSLTQFCDKKYYTVGLNIQQLPIVFADLCFDLDNMHLKFIHYIAKVTGPVLSHQVNQNADFSTKVEAPAESFFLDETSAHKLIKNKIGNQIDFLTFNYEELYPSDNLSPYIFGPLHIAKRLNSFLGWTAFTRGNWKSFRNLLKSRSKKVTYDVYLGTSDVIVAPTNDECKSFKSLDLEEFSKTVSVPKYVWAYLKSKENQTDEFVVIGVNSPYFEFFPRNETIFCDDICHEIDWFAPMEMFRKITTFGYMFCCRKEQVEKRLDGFPVFNVNEAIPEATTKPIKTFPLFDVTKQLDDENYDLTIDDEINNDNGGWLN